MTTPTFKLGAAALILAATLPAAQAQDAPAGDFLLDMRARYETVEQTGKLDAEAFTVRTRLGWQSPEWNGMTFLGEIENTTALNGEDSYNSGLNGLTQYAGIKDGEFTELNRLQLAFSPAEAVTVTLGRQYLGFDDGRFVASAGHRQDKNSHDAVQFDWENGAFEASYVYHWQINRGPGDDSNWDSDSHLFHLGYALSENASLAGFLYLIDIAETGSAAERSNMTWGARYAGSRELRGWSVDYAAMYARQSDYGSATTEFELGYFAGDLGFGRGGASLDFGYDVIEGNGSTGFSNPLGSNHSVLGWADAFSGGGRQGTVDGVEDFNIMASWETELNAGLVSGLSAGLRHHDFEAERTGMDLGEEWDAHISADLGENLSLSWQVADYDGPDVAPAPADRTKTFLILSYAR